MTTMRHRPIIRAVISLALLAAVGVPRIASAVQLDYSCEISAAILTGDDDRLKFSLVGETIGAASMIANLVCFVGDGRCGCLRRVTDGDRDENSQFAQELGRIIAGCVGSNPSRSLSGISQEAALNVCR